MILLQNPRYEMQLGFCYDFWKLKGNVIGHPRFADGDEVTLSVPKTLVYIENDDWQLETVSGSVYKLSSPKEDLIEQIRKDIANGGYEVH